MHGKQNIKKKVKPYVYPESCYKFSSYRTVNTASSGELMLESK